MNINDIRKQAPEGANYYIKKPLGKVRYLHGHGGIYWYLDKQGVPTDICREWIIWIKPL